MASAPASTSVMAASSSAAGMIRLRILAASTGVCYPVTLHPNELSVANIRTRLATAHPINDQILLLGPPYKVPKDSLLRTAETLAALRLGDEEDESLFHDDPESSPSTAASAAANESGATTAETDPQRRRSSSSRHQHGILGATERTGSKRLFLFSKRALSDGAADPPPCILEPGPGPLALPSESDMPPAPPRDGGIAAGGGSQSKSPLLMALEVYERQFALNLARGRAYADGADLRLAACRRCVSEQAVVARALRAAVSNLADHRASAARERTHFASEYTGAAVGHAALLKRFDARLSWGGGAGGGGGDVTGGGSIAAMAIGGGETGGGSESHSLGNTPLHPALVATARSAGRVMETLLDAVPLDRERPWERKCRTAHERLGASFHELDSTFGAALGTSVSWKEEVRGDMDAEAAVKALYAEVEGRTGIRIRNSQAERLAKLADNHMEAVRIVSSATQSEGGGGGGGGGAAHSAFTSLEEMTKSSSTILPSMESEDAVLAELSQRVADSKTDAMRRMKARLRQISSAQSAIQRAHHSVTVLRDALTQQRADVEHLEHVVELPASYRDFLAEIRRRRAYCTAVSASAAAMVERLGGMRTNEVKLREKFLRGPGRHLMPAFFEIFAPTLATSPPQFAPQLPDMIEMDTLPDVGDENSAVAAGTSLMESANNERGAREDARVSSASTLTDCPSLQHASSSIGGSGGRAAQEMEGTSSDAMSSEPAQKSAHSSGGKSADNPSPIVSADENSNNDVIMETVCQGESSSSAAARRAEDNARCATLEYENAVLRQSLERLGGKAPPRTYVEESRAGLDEDERRKSPGKLKDEKIAGMESELAKLRKDLAKAKESSTDASSSSDMGGVDVRPPDDKLCDKISHSSFRVGDCGLFMPTGRGRGGYRIYLAFHTNCPHRYLSPDCINGNPDYVLGRIVFQEEKIAGAIDSDQNPYGLHVGTKFWVLTVETLKKA